MLQLVRGRRPPYMSDVAVDWRPASLQCINNVKLQLVGGRRPPFYIMSDAARGGRLNALRTWWAAEGRPYISYVAVGGRPRAALREDITMYI